MKVRLSYSPFIREPEFRHYKGLFTSKYKTEQLYLLSYLKNNSLLLNKSPLVTSY